MGHGAMSSWGRSFAGAVPVLSLLFACGDELENRSNEECVVVRFGIETAAADPASHESASSAAHCASFLRVQSVRAASPSPSPGRDYVVTVTNGASVAIELSGAELQGHYATSSADARASWSCAVALRGTLAPGESGDVVMPCTAGPAAGESFLVVRLGRDESRFQLPD